MAIGMVWLPAAPKLAVSFAAGDSSLEAWAVGAPLGPEGPSVEGGGKLSASWVGVAVQRFSPHPRKALVAAGPGAGWRRASGPRSLAFFFAFEGVFGRVQGRASLRAVLRNKAAVSSSLITQLCPLAMSDISPARL